MLCKRRLKAFAEKHLDAKTCTQELEHDVNVHREDLKSKSFSLVTY